MKPSATCGIQQPAILILSQGRVVKSHSTMTSHGKKPPFLALLQEQCQHTKRKATTVHLDRALQQTHCSHFSHALCSLKHPPEGRALVTAAHSRGSGSRGLRSTRLSIAMFRAALRLRLVKRHSDVLLPTFYKCLANRPQPDARDVSTLWFRSLLN